PDPVRRAKTRAALAANSDFIWLAAGRLALSKDYPNLLRAFAIVHASCPDARLWIAGQGTADESSALLSLAAELGVDRTMQWLGLRHDLPALLDAADAFVLSAAWEGMPLALAEAMAMEKPVVATDVGGVRELVLGAGTIVPARDAEALAQAMLVLMRETSAARAAQCRAARQRIQQHFSIEARAGEWESFYRALAGHPATSDDPPSPERRRG
ncbi:MAG: glycosyltransferase, partial [Terracidiphilus sp.]